MPVENAWANYRAKRWETMGVKTLFRRFPQRAFKQFYQSEDALAEACGGRERLAFHQRFLDGVVIGWHDVEDVGVQGGGNHIFAQADMAIVAVYNQPHLIARDVVRIQVAQRALYGLK